MVTLPGKSIRAAAASTSTRAAAQAARMGRTVFLFIAGVLLSFSRAFRPASYSSAAPAWALGLTPSDWARISTSPGRMTVLPVGITVSCPR